MPVAAAPAVEPPCPALIGPGVALRAPDDGHGLDVLRLAGVPGLLLHRATSGVQVQVGDVQAHGADAARLLAAHWSGAAAFGRRVAAVHVGDADAARYAAHGCSVTRLGTAEAIDLGCFALGRAPGPVRDLLWRARRAGVHVHAAVGGPAAGTSAGDDRGRARFVARDVVGRELGDVLVATAAPVRLEPAWRVLRTTLAPGAPAGTATALLVAAAAAGRHTGVRRLHLPPRPFVAPGLGQHPARSRLVATLVEAVALWQPRPEQSAGWPADLTSPTYVALPARCSPRTAWAVLRVAASTAG